MAQDLLFCSKDVQMQSIKGFQHSAVETGALLRLCSMTIRRWYPVLCTVILIVGVTSLAYAFVILENGTEKRLSEIRHNILENGLDFSENLFDITGLLDGSDFWSTDSIGSEYMLVRRTEYVQTFGISPDGVTLDNVVTGRDSGWQMHPNEKSVALETYTPPLRRDDRRLLDDLREVINFHAKRRGLSEALVKAVIHAESGGNPLAKSRSGACGLMQLMPTTAAEMGIHNLFDPDQNIAGGTRYLAKMLELFDGNKELALAAYNAGPRTVRRYRGVPPYRETRVYIQRVLRFEKDYASARPIRLS